MCTFQYYDSFVCQNNIYIYIYDNVINYNNNL